MSYVDIVTTETTDKYKGILKCSHDYLCQIKRMENETFLYSRIPNTFLLLYVEISVVEIIRDLKWAMLIL